MIAPTGLTETRLGRRLCYSGIVSGYAVTVYPQRRVGEVRIGTPVQAGFNNLRNAMTARKFRGFSVGTAFLRSRYLEIDVRLSEDCDIDEWERVCEQLTELCRQFWYLPEEQCFICLKKDCDCTVLLDGTRRLAHETCARRRIARRQETELGVAGAKPYLGAAAGALALLIMLLVVLLVSHGYYPALFAAAAFLAHTGYQLLHGRPGRSAWLAVGLTSLVSAALGYAAALFFSARYALFYMPAHALLLTAGAWLAGLLLMLPRLGRSAAAVRTQYEQAGQSIAGVEILPDPESGAVPEAREETGGD